MTPTSVVRGPESRGVASSYAGRNSTYTWDVFLSFRGDTRKGFTDHLYMALWAARIRTFRDKDGMKRGKCIKTELEWAIKGSKISVIIFSQKYAESKWCLDELLLILESNHQVIPVFYNIKPTNVRKQTGTFADAFSRYEEQLKVETDHQRRINWMEKVAAWRMALEQVAGLFGMELEDKYETQLVEEIIHEIKLKLNHPASSVHEHQLGLYDCEETFHDPAVSSVHNHQFAFDDCEETSHDCAALFVPRHLVGIEYRIKPIQLWLQDASAKAAVLVLSGMGGSGKTTIAKCVYNSNFQYFEGCSFVADVGEIIQQPSGLNRLLCQILSDILKKKIELTDNVATLIKKIKYVISTKRVFLIFDNVNGRDILDSLLSSPSLLQGSKIIITTRDKGLPQALGVPYVPHTVELLNDCESMELFSWAAFRQSQPLEEYLQQSEMAVKYCNGNPLALNVLGSALYGRMIYEWNTMLARVSQLGISDIFDSLFISYDSLDNDNDKEIFLHIACFFDGEDKDYIVSILDGCNMHPTVGIHNLVCKGLINIDERTNKLIMHTLLRDMGREIVRYESPKELGRRSRLWYYKDSFEVLTKKTGTSTIEGLAIDMQRIRSYSSTTSDFDFKNTKKNWFQGFLSTLISTSDQGDFEINALAQMPNLALLKLDHVHLTGPYTDFPPKVKWLRWHGFPLTSIPMELPLADLVALDMQNSRLERVWKRTKILTSMKILNLSYSEKLVRTPDFTGLPNLERLILKGCIGLVEVCESIGILERLVLLDLEDCKLLRNLPPMPGFKGTLVINGCSNLDRYAQQSYQWNGMTRGFSSQASSKELDLSSNVLSRLSHCTNNLSRLVNLMESNIVRQLLLSDKTPIGYDAGSQQASSSNCLDCQNVVENERNFKLVPIGKVGRKVINSLGFRSRFEVFNEVVLFDETSESMNKRHVQVLHEFGVFSMTVAGKVLPSCQHYVSGSSISFRVPSRSNHPIIQGLTVFFMYTVSSHQPLLLHPFLIKISDKTKKVDWLYNPTFFGIPKYGEDLVWSSHWKIGNQLEEGDEVQVSVIVEDNFQVKRCGFSVIYEEEEDSDEETDNKSRVFLSWGERTFIDLSNHSTTRKAVFLGCNNLIDKLLYSNLPSLHRGWFHNIIQSFDEIEDIELLTWSGPHPEWPEAYHKLHGKSMLNPAGMPMTKRNRKGKAKAPENCTTTEPEWEWVDENAKRKTKSLKLEEKLESLVNTVETMSKAAAVVPRNDVCCIREAMALLDQIPEIARMDDLFMLATRLFLKPDNREMFLALGDRETRLAWLRQEQKRE